MNGGRSGDQFVQAESGLIRTMEPGYPPVRRQLAQNLIFTLPRTPFAQVEEILKHLTVLDASEVEMSTSLRLDRLAFREKTSVLKGFRPSLQWGSNQPTPEYRRVAQSGRISR